MEFRSDEALHARPACWSPLEARGRIRIATLTDSSLSLLVRSLCLVDALRIFGGGVWGMDLKDCFFALFKLLPLFARGVCLAGLDEEVSVRRARSMEETEALFCCLVPPVGDVTRRVVERTIFFYAAAQQIGRGSPAKTVDRML